MKETKEITYDFGCSSCGWHIKSKDIKKCEPWITHKCKEEDFIKRQKEIERWHRKLQKEQMKENEK